MRKQAFNRYLTTTGAAQTELADYNAVGNYSVTAQDFKILAPSGKIVEINKMVLVINDGGAVGQDKYGEVVDALTGDEGILVQYTKDGVLTDLTDGVLIQSNFEWNKIATKSERESADNDILTVTLDFLFDNNVPIEIQGSDEFRVRLKGNFSILQFHTFFVKGNIRNA